MVGTGRQSVLWSLLFMGSSLIGFISCESDDTESSYVVDPGTEDVNPLVDARLYDVSEPEPNDVMGETPGPGARMDSSPGEDVMDAAEPQEDTSSACSSDNDCIQDSNPCTQAICGNSGECQTEFVDSACDDEDPCTANDLCVDGVCTAGRPLDCESGTTCIDGTCVADPIPSLVINEVDYVQPTDAAGAFIEVLNVGTEPEPLEALTVDLISAESGSVYASISLAELGSLDSGEYLVLGTPDVLEALPQTAASLLLPESLETGAHGVLLRNATSVIDSVAFGGEVVGISEGGPAPVDTGLGSLSRCPNGSDTNNNATDFSVKPETAGSVNVCQVSGCTLDSECEQDDNPCTVSTCNVDVGVCTSSLVDGPCDDGDVCTIDETCIDGVCQAGVAVECEQDDNVCTTATCLPELGCQPQNNEALCDDGDACTEGDQCLEGQCTSGVQVQCDDDGNECTLEACEPAVGCVSKPTEGSCDDGNACTGPDQCVSGVCTPGNQIECDDDDGNECTSVDCDSALGCVTSNKAGACSDGSICTTNDTCVQGECVPGEALECVDDGNVCTTETCDPLTGCQSSANDGPCSDGDECTTGDACANSVCQPGEPVVCVNDDNVCTSTACSPDSGCTTTNQPGPCSDGNSCTIDDQCVTGECISGAELACQDDGNPCTTEACDPENGCESTPNQLPCSDNNACTSGDACSEGACVAGSIVECQPDGNPCTVTVCLPADGCTSQPDDLATCSDGNECTVDVCIGGTCDSAGVVTCEDDGNPCTTEACDPDNGCQSTNNSESCDDQDACTTGDQCVAGSCVAGQTVQCADDGNPCTSIACDSTDGCVTTFVDGDCTDNNLCTAEDTCIDGVCTGSQPVTCTQDSNPCTIHQCTAESGCVAAPVDADCDDNDPCTTGDACVEGVCTADPVLCAAGKVCVNGGCVDEATGTLVINEVDYDQPGADTNEFVEIINLGPAPQGLDGVVVIFINGGTTLGPYLEVSLASQGALGVGQRLVLGAEQVISALPTGVMGVLLPSAIQNGPDAISLRVQGQIVDSVSYGGVVAFAGEGQAAVADTGDGGISRCPDGADTDDNEADFRFRISTPGLTNDCGCLTDSDCPNDSTVCTQTTCNVTTGACDVEFTTAACDDGDACTAGDICSDGTCNSGVPVTCPDDGNVCTSISCVPAEGCTTTNIDGGCEDGDACTENDTCQQGVCSGGATITCSQDNNPCTVAVCDSVAGCQPENLAGACNDGDACTVGEGCAFGNCIGGSAVTCPDDGNPCTVVACEPAEGCVVSYNNSASCNDDDPCTTDVCIDGACISTPLVCDGDAICEEGECVAPPLDCADYSACLDACATDEIACIDSCKEQADPNAITSYELYLDCVAQQCPDGLQECLAAAKTETGSCFSPYVSCFGCEPQCAGKDCGSNACGGSCGTCETGTFCSADFICVAVAFEKLVINEIDYDQPGTDTNDFIELYNVGDTNVALANYTLEFINGSGGTTYKSLNLGAAPSAVLAPGDYVVIAQQALAPNTLIIDFSIQNGPADGVRIVGLAGNVVDSVSYEGALANVTEGADGAPTDTGVADGVGLSRCENGEDTDQNGADFLVVPTSPGFTNNCPVCEPACIGKSCGDDGCGGSCGDCADEQICLPSGGCIVPSGSCAGAASCAIDCANAGGEITACLDSCTPTTVDAVSLYNTWRECIEPLCTANADAQCLQSSGCQAELNSCTNPCTPDCTGKVCGDNGCNGSCGSCAPGEACSTGGQCEVVGCASDVDCPSGSQCDETTSQCVCAPQCDGKTCGDDGCGSNCGICSLGSFCTADDVCEQLACVGDTQCPSGSSCISGVCTCTPQCSASQECGSDGCGGECGQCGPGSSCTVTGVCVSQPQDCSEAFFCTLNCLAVANGNTGSCFSQCLPSSGSDAYIDWFNCIDPACTSSPNDLGCISANPACEALATNCQTSSCTSDCTGKVCGDDGCGGACGDCGTGFSCSVDGSTCDADSAPLLINELDYALPGNVAGEFIEIYNASAGDIDIASAQIDLVDGDTGLAYQTIPLSAADQTILPSGGYLAVSNGPLAGASIVLASFSLQDGSPDGVALYLGGQLVDFVSYEGTIFGYGATVGSAPEDSGVLDSKGISRCANGQDTDDNTVDFLFTDTTPGSPNDCTQCVPDCSGKTCGDNGCGESCGDCATGTECNSSGQCTQVLLNCSESYNCLALCLDQSEFAACATQCEPKLSEQLLLYQELIGCLSPECSVAGTGVECLATTTCTSAVEQCITAECVPQCDGKQCGDNGCGDVCGTCAAGAQCLENGTCEAIGCQSDADCPTGTGCNLQTATCGCVPQCDGKQCGDNGCGGSCGTCAGGGECSAEGTCPQPETCAAAITCLEGCIQGGTDISNCYIPCLPTNASEQFDFDNLYFCAFAACAGSTDPACLTQETSCAANYTVCATECVPTCGTKTCGGDGCGGSCGTCSSDSFCSLQGNCQPKPTTCSGSKDCYAACLTNTGDVTTCVFLCEPSTGTAEAISNFFAWTQCIEGVCLAFNGDPGCLGIDPACDSLAVTCDSDSCTPACGGKTCGDDGCGGSCGACALGDECTANGVCQDVLCSTDVECPSGTACASGVCECAPQCNGKTCGDDGCGGTCGTCGAGLSCFADGLCYGDSLTCSDGADCTSACIGTGLEPFDCLAQCAPPDGTSARGFYNEWFACIFPGCSADAGNASCTEAPECSAAYDACQNVLCIPECAKKQCGDDGCGGSCGSCTGGSVCSALGVCQEDKAALVLNEVDITTGSLSLANYIELFNAGTQPVAIDGFTVEVVDALNQQSTLAFTLPNEVIAPGGYVVIGGEATIPLIAPSAIHSLQDILWSGTGGVAVVLRDSGQVVLDSLASGEDIPPFTETSAAPADTSSEGLSRCPNGLDSDDNSKDFLLVALSPGSSNSCPICVPACTDANCGPDGCGGLCGVCGNGETCSSGNCVAVGCSGDQDCPPGTACDSVTGQCLCAPDCAGKGCGDNGCGGSCGECVGDAQCSLEGQCVTPIIAGLKISEIDCVQPDSNLLEFVEIYNSSESPISLAGKALELLDSNGTAYVSVDLGTVANELPALSYLVIGDFELLATIPAETVQLHVELDILDNDAGARILDQTGVLDAVAYGNVSVAFGEGNPAVAATNEFSMQRCPPENDTDDNQADFSAQISTPAGGCF